MRWWRRCPTPPSTPRAAASSAPRVAYNRLLVGFDHRTLRRARPPHPHLARLRRRTASLWAATSTPRAASTPRQPRNTSPSGSPRSTPSWSPASTCSCCPTPSTCRAPQMPRLNQVPDPFTSRRLIAEHSTRFTAEPARLRPGAVEAVRRPQGRGAACAATTTPAMHQAWVDPRLAVFYQVHPQVLLKGAAGLYHQPPDYRLGPAAREASATPP